MGRRLSTKMCVRFQRAADLLCKRWTKMIVQILLERPRRFNELLGELEVVSDRMLSERLKELELEGIVLRRLATASASRSQYCLTPKGSELGPIIAAMQAWSLRHMAASGSGMCTPPNDT